MSAIIKLEIEGTAEEIMAAFKTFVGKGKAEVFTVDVDKFMAQPAILDTVPREETDYVPELEYPGPRCEWCQTLLTQKQIDQGNKYCCRSCAFKGTNKVRQETRRANRKEKKVALGKLIRELKCLECNKPLTKGQKKFCSKLHSNRYHMRERKLSKLTATHAPVRKPITIVAGQGIIKGTALQT